MAVVDSISCNGLSDGQVIANPAGTSPYMYHWSNGQFPAIATNLSANIAYTVTVTDAQWLHYKPEHNINTAAAFGNGIYNTASKMF